MLLVNIFILAVVVFLIALFIPFDWWRKRPSQQPDTPIGRWLGKIADVSPRNLTIRAWFLTFLLALGPVLLLWLLVVLPVVALFAPVVHVGHWLFKRDFRPDDEPLLGALLILVLIWLTAVGLAAPLLALAIAAYFVLGKPAGGLIEGLATFGPNDWPVHLIVASAGLLVVALWLYRDALWRFRQAGQVDNLPTSKAGSVALGLVELRGWARSEGSEHEPIISLNWSMFDYLQPTQKLRPFYLQDKTGRVLVDPTECRVRAGWVTDLASMGGCHEIMLKRRVEKDDGHDSVTRTLMPGDPVYLIGNAEVNPQAAPDAVDSERLVIRPAIQSSWSLSLWRFLFGKAELAKGRSIFNVFFLADKEEVSAKQLILNGFHTVLAVGGLWLASPAVLFWFALHPISPPPDSWREAYWVGEPFERAHFRRFEKHMKSLGYQPPPAYRYLRVIPDDLPSDRRVVHQSHEAIPALLEALRYEDLRYRERAADRLRQFLPAAREQAKDAVPLLIETLTISRDPNYIQTTIIALGEFGPLAAPAVPYLIVLLRHEDDFLRAQTAVALRRIGPAAGDAVPALTKTLEDRRPFVRKAAADALKTIQGR